MLYEVITEFDTISVGPGLSLDAVSIIAGTDTDIIKELNAELRTGKTPANQTSYAVRIPPGTVITSYSIHYTKLYDCIAIHYLPKILETVDHLLCLFLAQVGCKRLFIEFFIAIELLPVIVEPAIYISEWRSDIIGSFV